MEDGGIRKMRRRRGKVEDEDPGEGKGSRTKMMRTDM